MDWRSAPDAKKTVAASCLGGGEHPTKSRTTQSTDRALDVHRFGMQVFSMLRRLVRRGATSVGLVVMVVTLTFVLLNAAPGDPARFWVGPNAGQAELEAARRALGLDRPFFVQYAHWIVNFVRGEWGMSLTQQRPVADVIRAALPHTIVLSAGSLFLTYLLGIIVGTFQASKRHTTWDRTITTGSLFIVGMPAYWLAIMLVLVFVYTAARFGWPLWMRFPALGVASLDAEFYTGWGRFVDRLRHLALPLTTLSLLGVATTSRFVRNAVLETQFAPFVTAAKGRGLKTVSVTGQYVVRNALMPVITLLGMSLPALFSGTVFIEVIFAWPGMGREIVNAVATRDYPVVLATTAIFSALVVAGNFVADLLYAVADPRQRSPEG